MVDSNSDNQEDFVISKNGDEGDEAEELGQKDYYGNHTSVFQKKSVIPFVIGGVGLAVIIIVLLFLIAGSGDVAEDGQLRSIEKRIQQLEAKLATIGVIDQTVDRLAKQEQDLKAISERLDRLDKTVNTQINQIIKELGSLHKRTSQKPPPGTQAVQPAARSKQKTKSKYHQVRPGETLYGISRLYGLTVEQLRNYNNIGPDTAIQPGQKLKLNRNGSQ